VLGVDVARFGDDETVIFPVRGKKALSLLRDQLWFGLQQWLKDGGTIPQDPKLEAELVAPTYAFDVRGRIKVEPKEKIKERLRRSPDRADALALAVAPLYPWGQPRITWL
jgi:hypothetical protein